MNRLANEISGCVEPAKIGEPCTATLERRQGKLAIGPAVSKYCSQSLHARVAGGLESEVHGAACIAARTKIHILACSTSTTVHKRWRRCQSGPWFHARQRCRHRGSCQPRRGGREEHAREASGEIADAFYVIVYVLCMGQVPTLLPFNELHTVLCLSAVFLIFRDCKRQPTAKRRRTCTTDGDGEAGTQSIPQPHHLLYV